MDALEKEMPMKGGKTRRVTWYKVRWKGYGDPYDTWEPETHLKNAPEVVEAWRQAGAR